MEERPPIWRVAVHILNKSRTAEKGWSSSLGVWRGVDNSSALKLMLRNSQTVNFEPGLILWYDLSNAKGT